MPREPSLGNGNLQVNLDANLNIRDMYFPYVGLENHDSGHFCRFGVWVDNVFPWVDDSWTKKLGYKAEPLVTDSLLKKPSFRVELRIQPRGSS